MEYTTKLELQEIHRSLQDLTHRLGKINQDVLKINEQVGNFIFLLDKESDALECPYNYEKCHNNEEYCVFKYASEEDKKEF